MSLFSQLAILILIAGVSAILFRSNRDLERVCEEGEQFVDEWSLHLARKAELEMELEAERKRRIEDEKKHEEMPQRRRETEMGFSGDEAGRRSIEDTSRGGKGVEGSFLPLIQVLDGDERPIGQVCVNRTPFWIGRDPSCDLRIADLCVARRHCSIVQEGQRFILLDHGTRNQLFAQGRVLDHVELTDGCRVRIGETILSVALKESGRSGPVT